MSLATMLRRSCQATTQPLALLEFLAPSFACRRTGRRQASTASTGEGREARRGAGDESHLPLPALSKRHREYLDRALRVNHAGELAATLIYTAQTPVLARSNPRLRPLMRHMYDQEAGHLRLFEHLLRKHRVRPTAMYPAWHVAATALGWATAMMGHEAAMACTEAVETEIGNHYNGQVRDLLGMIKDIEADGGAVGDELADLVHHIRITRDEELQHLDHAVDNDAQKAQGHVLLSGVIRGGCRAAIWVSERI
ncbi:MAG: hypothetical protein M1815_005107 [Lichina confinis]|nr:MAG: hypothetical protein M1815_005107 [Lichina confinis]